MLTCHIAANALCLELWKQILRKTLDGDKESGTSKNTAFGRPAIRFKESL
jgi:hypothetical protein